MKDFFRPHSDPARLIYDAFQEEAKKRCVSYPERGEYGWVEAERRVVWQTARDYAQQHGMRIPTMAEVERAEQNAMGHVDYGSKWAYGVVEAMCLIEPKPKQMELTETMEDEK